MTEPEYKSECCGEQVYGLPWTYLVNGNKTRDEYVWHCFGCHKPTTVRKEEEEDEKR